MSRGAGRQGAGGPLPVALFMCALVTAAATCRRGGGQSYGDAVRIICESALHVSPDISEAGKAQAASAYVNARLENAEGEDLMRTIALTPGRKKAKVLRAEAARVGLDRCALAGMWEGP